MLLKGKKGKKRWVMMPTSLFPHGYINREGLLKLESGFRLPNKNP